MIFKENIKVLKSIDPRLAEAILCISKDPGLKITRTKTGMYSLISGNTTLHSLYDPLKEAQLWVKYYKRQIEKSETIVVLGFGLGYHIAELIDTLGLESLSRLHLFVFEPRLDILRTALENIDLTGVLPKIRLITGNKIPQLKGKFSVLEHKPSVNLSHDYFTLIDSRLKVLQKIKRGLRIMVVSPIYGGSYPIAKYCVSALGNLGHHVDFVDNSIYKDAFLGIPKITKNRNHQNQLRELFVNFVSEAIVARCGEFRPDLVFALAQAPLNETALLKLKGYKIPTAFWFVEDFRQMEYWKDMAPLYDFFFTIQKDVFHGELEKAGVKNYHYLPLGAAPDIHRKIQLSKEEQGIYGSDVSFVGAGYYNRRKFFEGLLDLDFKIWGNEWDLASPLSECIQQNGKRIETEEIVKIFNATKININLHSSKYHEGINPYGDFVNPRTFEIAACGGFQLVDLRSELPNFFKINEEIVCFEDLEDLRQKISYYLKNPEKRQEIARRGRHRVLDGHTYEDRMREMMEFIFDRGYELPVWHSGERDVDKLIKEAGKDTDLGIYLAKFAEKERIGLNDIIEDIRKGDGDLSEVETIFLFMNAIKEQYMPDIKG